MTKHAPTPGPWIVDGEDEFPLGIPVIGIATAVCPDPNWKLIAYVQPNADNFKLGEEDHANAHVLAAAPDLLAALRDAVQCHGPFGDDSRPAWWQAAVAAIAKAEDRS